MEAHDNFRLKYSRFYITRNENKPVFNGRIGMLNDRNMNLIESSITHPYTCYNINARIIR